MCFFAMCVVACHIAIFLGLARDQCVDSFSVLTPLFLTMVNIHANDT